MRTVDVERETGERERALGGGTDDEGVLWCERQTGVRLAIRKHLLQRFVVRLFTDDVIPQTGQRRDIPDADRCLISSAFYEI